MKALVCLLLLFSARAYGVTRTPTATATPSITRTVTPTRTAVPATRTRTVPVLGRRITQPSGPAMIQGGAE